MIDKKIVQIKKSIEKWEYRILASFGVDPCKCPKCGGKMRFNDIVYPRYGSMREQFKLYGFTLIINNFSEGACRRHFCSAKSAVH